MCAKTLRECATDGADRPRGERVTINEHEVLTPEGAACDRQLLDTTVCSFAHLD